MVRVSLQGLAFIFDESEFLGADRGKSATSGLGNLRYSVLLGYFHKFSFLLFG